MNTLRSISPHLSPRSLRLHVCFTLRTKAHRCIRWRTPAHRRADPTKQTQLFPYQPMKTRLALVSRAHARPNLTPTAGVTSLRQHSGLCLTAAGLLIKLPAPQRGPVIDRFVKVWRWTVDTSERWPPF